MAANGIFGEPGAGGIPRDPPTVDEMLDAATEGSPASERSAEEAARQMAAIKEELKQLSQSVSQLTEATARYGKQRVEEIAESAVLRYPIGSIVTAALVGYWLAGRRR